MSIFKKTLKLDEQEQGILDLICSMVSRKDCDIEINPDDFSYLVSLEKLQYYLLIDSLGIRLSNHEFFISRKFSDKVLDKFKEVIKKEVVKRREAKVNNIFKNEMELLIKINNNINNGRVK